jgi:hypothetical protein
MDLEQITTLRQAFNAGIPSTNSIKPETIYNEMLTSHSYKPVRLTNMRNLIRLTVSKRALQLQIDNFYVITMVTDILIKESPSPIKLEYRNLADEVNKIIKSRRG